MKKCVKCEKIKSDCDYYKNHDDCKECWNKYCSIRRKLKIEKDPDYLIKRRKYLQEWREKNQEKDKSYVEKSLKKNKDKISARRKTPEARKKMNVLVKAWREKNKERFKETEKLRRDKDRINERARRLIYKHITRGHIKRPEKCELCLKKCKPDAHHDDYSKPLEVRWLCRICHRHAHGKLLDLKPIDE